MTVPMAEADLQAAVIDLARLLGYRVAHFRAARVGRGDDQRWVTPVAADGAGFPDLTLVSANNVLFVELKSAKGRVSDDQQAWLDALQATSTVIVKVWRPSDWHDGTVESTLRRLA